jgi:hypothetical protein
VNDGGALLPPLAERAGSPPGTLPHGGDHDAHARTRPPLDLLSAPARAHAPSVFPTVNRFCTMVWYGRSGAVSGSGFRGTGEPSAGSVG